MKTTDWYPGTVKPAYVGVYECEFEEIGEIRRYFNFWDGGAWHYGRGYHLDARVEYYQSVPLLPPFLLSGLRGWRGLTEPHCKKCSTQMVEGVACVTGYYQRYGFPGADMGTVSPGGSGWRIDCYKCPACGWSMTR